MQVLAVTPQEYLKDDIIASEKRIIVNDALAYLKMKELGLEEIYNSDRHFVHFDVKVLP